MRQAYDYWQDQPGSCRKKGFPNYSPVAAGRPRRLSLVLCFGLASMFERFGVVNASSHKFRTCPSCHAPHRRQSPEELRSFVLGSAELRASLHRFLEACSPQSPFNRLRPTCAVLLEPRTMGAFRLEEPRSSLVRGLTAIDPYDPHHMWRRGAQFELRPHS